jgi:hypothetical protein
MTTPELHALGEALFGERWQSSLARSLGMSERHMRRLAAGTAEISEGMETEIRALAKQRGKQLLILAR